MTSAGTPEWDPFDGVPPEQVFARRYLKGVALRLLFRVVAVLSALVAGTSLLTRDASLLLLVPAGLVALVLPVLLATSMSGLESPTGCERAYREADLGGLRSRLREGSTPDAADRRRALALHDEAVGVRRRTPRVGAWSLLVLGAVASWTFRRGGHGDEVSQVVGFVAYVLAVVVVLGSLSIVSGRVVREMRSVVVDSVAHDEADGARG